MYGKRILHYVDYQNIEIPELKNVSSLSHTQIKEKEGELIFKHLSPLDKVILLDERGKEYTSVEWAHSLEKEMVQGVKSLVFIIGGAYGFSEEVYKRANALLSLSKMTYSHQIIRIFFTEQLYRALTIIKGEPYHNA